jgi:hypothetical protein
MCLVLKGCIIIFGLALFGQYFFWHENRGLHHAFFFVCVCPWHFEIELPNRFKSYLALCIVLGCSRMCWTRIVEAAWAILKAFIIPCILV